MNTVDERAARLVACIVVITAVASLLPGAWPLVALLAADFTIRGFGDRRYSPLRLLAKSLIGWLGWQPKPTYAPPKRFAAQIGSALTIGATLLHVSGLHAAAVVLTAMLIAAASLEAAIGLCLACWLYPFVYRLRGAEQAEPIR